MVTDTTLPDGFRLSEYVDGLIGPGRRTVSVHRGDQLVGWYDHLASGQFIVCLSNSVVADEATALQRLVAAARALSGEEQEG